MRLNLTWENSWYLNHILCFFYYVMHPAFAFQCTVSPSHPVKWKLSAGLYCPSKNNFRLTIVLMSLAKVIYYSQEYKSA